MEAGTRGLKKQNHTESGEVTVTAVVLKAKLNFQQSWIASELHLEDNRCVSLAMPLIPGSVLLVSLLVPVCLKAFSRCWVKRSPFL